MSTTYQPSNACLQWTSEGMPFATDFGDVYYSRADALGESTHVFLEGNDLAARFRSLGCAHFVIGELGFGGGLNFLNTCLLWRSHAPATARLHYVACELHPFRKEDLTRLLQQFPSLAEPAALLLEQYPASCTGTHQLQFSLGQHRIILLLLHEAAEPAFRHLSRQAAFSADAWFLDGFAPRNNPAMWKAELLQHVAALSHAGTTLATYSVAGQFRRDLEAAGFSCSKHRGFSGKRHMLRAALRNAHPSIRGRMPPQDRQLCIVGGGLAGCSTAHAFAEAGWQVTLIEAGPALATGASGNPQGILHFKPGTTDAADNRFNLHAYLHATRHYHRLRLPGTLWSPCGMLQLANDHKLRKRFARLAESGMYSAAILEVLDAETASRHCGQQLAAPALYFPEAGWLSPAGLCAWYCGHPGIQVLAGHCVSQLERCAEGWELLMHGQQGERFLHARHVVLCNAADAWRFTQARHLPLICNRGQVDLYDTADARRISSVICGQGYLIPAGSSGQAVGGSFFLGDDDSAARSRNRRQHLQQLAEIHPELADHFAARHPLQQRISERCTLPGRMPAVGAIERHDGHGLWINVGHGSHGLARTPVCADLLLSLLEGTPCPLEPGLVDLLSPARFLATGAGKDQAAVS